MAAFSPNTGPTDVADGGEAAHQCVGRLDPGRILLYPTSPRSREQESAGSASHASGRRSVPASARGRRRQSPDRRPRCRPVEIFSIFLSLTRTLDAAESAAFFPSKILTSWNRTAESPLGQRRPRAAEKRCQQRREFGLRLQSRHHQFSSPTGCYAVALRGRQTAEGQPSDAVGQQIDTEQQSQDPKPRRRKAGEDNQPASTPNRPDNKMIHPALPQAADADQHAHDAR